MPWQMDCTARGKGDESVEEAETRVVWVHQTVGVTMTMKMEVARRVVKEKRNDLWNSIYLYNWMSELNDVVEVQVYPKTRNGSKKML